MVLFHTMCLDYQGKAPNLVGGKRSLRLREREGIPDPQKNFNSSFYN